MSGTKRARYFQIWIRLAQDEQWSIAIFMQAFFLISHTTKINKDIDDSQVGRWSNVSYPYRWNWQQNKILLRAKSGSIISKQVSYCMLMCLYNDLLVVHVQWWWWCILMVVSKGDRRRGRILPCSQHLTYKTQPAWANSYSPLLPAVHHSPRPWATSTRSGVISPNGKLPWMKKMLS